MILCKNKNQPTNQTDKQKTETDHGQEAQTQGSQGGKGRECDGWASWGFGDVNSYIWNGWALGSYRTAQGNVCDWVTLLYNRT